jgi:Peptidase M15
MKRVLPCLSLIAFSAGTSAHAEALLSPKTSNLSKADFSQWLEESPDRTTKFEQFSSFLTSRGVGHVVPIWSLTRGDRDRMRHCAGAGFIIPPHDLWANMVPALRLLERRVIPVIGRVEVVSVYRSAALNQCARGAPASRHLKFSALDLIAPGQPDGRTLFTKLCASWKAAGPRSGWGLGAYFDPLRPTSNRQARFHVDATGWRSWGFSKKAASSVCRLLSR